MADFQHPAEQGSTADDFITKNSSFPMYQYSVFLNGNRDEQIVVRASTFSELLAGKRNVTAVLTATSDHDEAEEQGSYSNGHTNGKYVCDVHEAQIFTVKKDGPNKGRTFKSCTKCKAFLGFV